MQNNAVTQLRQYLKAKATKPFVARGSKTKRCEGCLLREDMCICDEVSPQKTHAAFCLIMHKLEPLKPSNTGKLIADVVSDTQAFIWSRTEPAQEMIDFVNDSKWQPFVVFPSEGVEETRVTESVETQEGKRPLFILLDGTWRDAKRMFRKSPWLNQFPVLSFTPERMSDYQMRNAYFDHHICTAEVAVMALELLNEQGSADMLAHHFASFRKRYMANKSNLIHPSD